MITSYIVYFLSLSAGMFILIQKRWFTPPYFLLGIYLLGVGLLQITAHLFSLYFGSNALLYLVSIPVTYVVIFMIFHKLISIIRIKKQLWIFFGVLFAVIIFQFLYIDLHKIAAVSEILVTYNIGIVGFCLLYYLQMLQIPERIRPSRQGVFWIVTGFFFYFLLSFVYWMVSSLFPRTIPGLKYFNDILVIMFYLVLWVGIFVHLKEREVHGAR